MPAFKIPSLCQGGDRSWTNWVSLVYVSGSTVRQLLIGVIRARKQWCWCQLHTGTCRCADRVRQGTSCLLISLSSSISALLTSRIIITVTGLFRSPQKSGIQTYYFAFCKFVCMVHSMYFTSGVCVLFCSPLY